MELRLRPSTQSVAAMQNVEDARLFSCPRHAANFEYKNKGNGRRPTGLYIAELVRT